jgi:hypothetical protein
MQAHVDVILPTPGACTPCRNTADISTLHDWRLESWAHTCLKDSNYRTPSVRSDYVGSLARLINMRDLVRLT